VGSTRKRAVLLVLIRKLRKLRSGTQVVNSKSKYAKSILKNRVNKINVVCLSDLRVRSSSLFGRANETQTNSKRDIYLL
jgi:hypothetical protein